jgi:hypothetical protein
MNDTTNTLGSDDGFEPRKTSRSMIDTFLNVGGPSHMQQPRLGELKHSKNLKLCNGNRLGIEIRETERAVVIYLVGRSGGVVDDLLVRQAMQPLLQPYDSDPRPQYTVSDQLDCIVRATEVGGRVIAVRMSIEEGIAEIRGAPAAPSAEAAAGDDEPRLMFTVVRHDDWCPGVHGDGANCICSPTLDLVDEETWNRSYKETGKRAAKRADARNAKKGRP